MVIKHPFNIKAISSSEADIFLYGAVSEWDEVNAKDFIKTFKEAGQNYHTLNIHINSPGGSVFEGLAIYNAIISTKVNTDTYVDGLAASMGSVLIQSGRKRYMATNAMIMVHGAQGGTYDTADKLREMADLMDKLNDNIAGIYASKTGKEKQWILDNWMDGEDHWFTAEEALEAGLIDEIVDGDVRKAPKLDARLYDIAAYYNTELLNTSNKPQKTMDLIIQEINKYHEQTGITLSSTASEQEILVAMNKVLSKQKAQLTANAETITTLTSERDQAVADLAAKDADVLKTKAETLVSAAKSVGKCTEKQAERYLKLASASEEGFEFVKAELEEKKAYQPVHSQLTSQGAESDETKLVEAWDKAHKEGRLEKIKLTSPESYAEMFKAKFGREYQV